MRFRWRVAIALICCLLPIAPLAQNQPARTGRTLLATGGGRSVVETPLALRLLSVRLPSTQRASYSGPNAMLYALSGGLGLELGGIENFDTTGAGLGHGRKRGWELRWLPYFKNTRDNTELRGRGLHRDNGCPAGGP